MNDELAERLLATIMQWGISDDARERPILQSLAMFKYDDYQPYSPGMRFVESLALWLKQFDTIDERRTAYLFIKNRLLFISPKEMLHLVSITYPDYVRPFLVKKAGGRVGTSQWKVKKITESTDFRILHRQSLFLGLSDGAHIDVFRRSSTSIRHEQVLRSHEITQERAADMTRELQSDLGNLLGHEAPAEDARFRIVFLLDDFSGSGTSYLSKTDSGYTGKIWRFYESACTENGRIKGMFKTGDLHVCLVLYIASAEARQHLQKLGNELFGSIPFDVLTVCQLPDSVRVDSEKDSAFFRMLEKYFDSTVVDEHFLKGRHDRPYLGFNECALPLVLSHNTPNNSVCLLWSYEGGKYRGLFPRVSRHREEI